jgi:lipopolysaccharide/colanic/teichoic acid biosynthesis glycosyltransferase
MSKGQQIFDRVAAAAALVLLSPVFAVVAAAIVVDGGLPVLFRQKRVGKEGREFTLLKFRSMRADLSGAQITAGRDARITRVGLFIRKYKLDELPQFWNVIQGDMSLVGPRPELPAFVDLRDPLWREVLSVRPGITDLATLAYHDEQELLAGVEDVEQYYRRYILPIKLQLNIEYIHKRSFYLDVKVLFLTLFCSLFPRAIGPREILQRIVRKDIYEFSELYSVPPAVDRTGRD